MAPKMKEEGNESKEQRKGEESVNQPSKRSKKINCTHRRTKTGCFTCRTRRIKCDEERPICKNCTKSKRDCRYQPPTRPAAVSTTFNSRTTFAPVDTLPNPPINDVQMQPTPGSPQMTVPIIGGVHDTFHHSTTAGHYPFPRYEWPRFSDGGGVSDYTQHSPGSDQTQIHMPEPQHYLPTYMTTGVPHSTYPPYPDSTLALCHADDPKSSCRRKRPQDNLAYQAQALPSHFHSFAFDDYDEDPEDPWDIEADDGYPWYNIGMAIQRRAAKIVSPILQERNAILLHHFVNFVRPCINLYERKPTFGAHGEIKSTWGSTLPSAAISHPALGHAILGLSALHLAVLYGSSDAAARKHILLSTKRIGKILGDSNQRHQVEVLACVLLLAFYEVMDADHSKWVVHLGGAASFLTSEHDWAGMARAIHRMRAQARANLGQPGVKHDRMAWSDYVRVAGIPQVLLSDEDWDVNEEVISKITGHKIDYINSYHPCSPSAAIVNDLSPQKAEEVMTKMDLFWWMMKQLIFHSLLSGDPLLIPYEQLLCCPPRGRLENSPIGAVDHLWLVLARLADFGGKDRIRKQTMMERKGQWVPPAGFLAKGSPAQTMSCRKDSPDSGTRDENVPPASRSRTRMPKNVSHATSTKTPKLFYGMLPPPAVPPSMMNSFHVMDAELHKHASSNIPRAVSAAVNDLDQKTQAALAEHASIAEALELWRSSLGERFHALRLHPEVAVETPFGPALRYDDPIFACCWAFYYLAKIMLQRFHPYSSPAMMVSAGVNAHLTKSDALAIGRIYWGILLDQKEIARQGSINPTIVAALQELSFPLMFAGVQFQDAAQRAALIESLMDVGREAGWKTASACASGCETSWETMGNMGKGPPYERTVAQRSPFGARRYNQKTHGSSSGIQHIKQENEHDSRFISHNRELIDRHAELRSYWAVGVLSLEEDLKKMSLAK